MFEAKNGGKGKDEIISEAEAMKKYLIENGISEENIILEDKSKNTIQNMRFSKLYTQRKSHFALITIMNISIFVLVFIGYKYNLM